MCCGCVMVLLTAVEIGAAMIVVGLLCSVLLGRCPHCGKMLPGIGDKVTHCPKCHRPL